MTWDIKWEVETYIGDGFYQCEFKIPLNSLKFLMVPKIGDFKFLEQIYLQVNFLCE